MSRSITACLALLLVGCNGGEKPPFDYCTGDPPDEACYRQKRDPGSDQIALAEAIARKQIEDHPADTLDWDWEEAVLLVGVHELHRITGQAEYRDYHQAWIDHHIAAGYEMKTSDTSAPARLALELYAQSGDAKYRNVIDDFFTYINERAALDEFALQHKIFTGLLQKESGWYQHAHDWPGNQDENVFWGRGNGWVAAATTDYLRVLLARSEKDKGAKRALDRLFAAILSTQDAESGLWWTVVNRPGETYLETSASALFAYALTRAWRYGVADDSVLATVEQAVSGVRAMITTDARDRPVVTGISGPTMPGSLEYYREIPVGDDLPFGLGAVLLMLVETSGLF
jgi:unsaturated rhamnogalacturonyl hydrolase